MYEAHCERYRDSFAWESAALVGATIAVSVSVAAIGMALFLGLLTEASFGSTVAGAPTTKGNSGVGLLLVVSGALGLLWTSALRAKSEAARVKAGGSKKE